MKRRLDSVGSSLDRSFGSSRDDLSSCGGSSNNCLSDCLANNSSDHRDSKPAARRRHSEGVGHNDTLLLADTLVESEADRLERLLDGVNCDAEASHGACMEVAIPDGRLSKDGADKKSRTILRLEPLEGYPSTYSLRLATSHYAFSLKRSATNRNIQEFYELSSILKSQHPHVSIESLPLRPLLYLRDTRCRAEQLAAWLTSVLCDRQLLSNRSLHLFLQTHLSMERIRQNAAGLRDDQVVSPFERKQGSGFKDLFGSHPLRVQVAEREEFPC